MISYSNFHQKQKSSKQTVEEQLFVILTSWRTLLFCDLSTLLIAKYSIVFFFLPLYTLYTVQNENQRFKEIPVNLKKGKTSYRDKIQVTEYLPRPMAS
jgi:hypothetical protein